MYREALHRQNEMTSYTKYFYKDAADASDHLAAANSIARGLIRGHSAQNPGYWLHTGGTGILTYLDSANNYAGLGKWSEKEFSDDDGEGIDEITNKMPDDAFHRNVDKVVLETGKAWSDKGVKTAIVCPPTIYGERATFDNFFSFLLEKNPHSHIRFY